MYQVIIIDTLNLLYRLRKTAKYESSKVNKKVVYKELFIQFIQYIQTLERDYLAEDGIIYFAKDFSYGTDSKDKIRKQSQKSSLDRHFISKEYKKHRKTDTAEFYNTLDLIKYYYLVNKPRYVNLQMQRREADDLVKPLLVNFCVQKKVLLVTNDHDWSRYLSSLVDWLPDRSKAPQTMQDFIDKNGYYPTESTVTIYKAIFGDKSDGIGGIVPENAINKDQVLPYLTETTTIQDIIRESCKETANDVLKEVQANMAKFRLNVQLISAAEVTDKHIQNVLCPGRDSAVIIEAIETAVGIRSRSSSFTFGNIAIE